MLLTDLRQIEYTYQKDTKITQLPVDLHWTEFNCSPTVCNSKRLQKFLNSSMIDGERYPWTVFVGPPAPAYCLREVAACRTLTHSFLFVSQPILLRFVLCRKINHIPKTWLNPDAAWNKNPDMEKIIMLQITISYPYV